MSEPRYRITVKDMSGWARVYLSSGEPACKLARTLSGTLTEWMKKNPHLRVKHIVPISRDRDTAELHVWYDVVPDAKGAPINEAGT